MQNKNLRLALLVLMGASLTLLGCGGQPSIHTIKVRNAGTLPRPLESKSSLITKLTAANIQVVEKGDHLRIIIPVDAFFDVDKSALSVSKEPILVSVAKLVLRSTSGPVYVQGHSDTMGYAADNVRRSLQQATDIAAVLWAYGVEQRRLQVQGYGSQLPVADNNTAEGRAFNRRIEIIN